VTFDAIARSSGGVVNDRAGTAGRLDEITASDFKGLGDVSQSLR